MNARPLAITALVLFVGCGPTPMAVEEAGVRDSGVHRCAAHPDCDDGVFCNGRELCTPSAANADPRGCTPPSGAACMAGQTCDAAMRVCQTMCDVTRDADHDGHTAIACGGDDCDDADPHRFPGNPEVCDAARHDEDCDPRTFGSRDGDHDTFIDATCCNVEAAGAAHCGTDCNDSAAAVSPVAVEVCNGLDDDCDTSTDEGVSVRVFVDRDGDLHGDPMMPQMACAGLAHFSTQGDDCDDHDVRVNAAQVEVCDGLDNDCNGVIDDHTRQVTWYADADADGFGSAAGGTRIACAPPSGFSLLPFDCDDTRAGINPAAPEVCNGRDDDCNGRLDFRLAPNDFEDDDADGFTDIRCGGLGDDCDDRDAHVHPGAPATCDGRDDNCDGVIDGPGAAIDWYLDADGDGWGTGTARHVCAAPTGYVSRAGDCDDSIVAKNPGVTDICNGVDDDCDGTTDEAAARVAFYADRDGDGAGGGAPMLLCAQPAGTGLFPTDCDDANPRRYPGAIEVCDGIDNDCDMVVDNGAAAACMLTRASAACVSGACTIAACSSGATDCDGLASNGCEAMLATDPVHCGTCATRCAGAANAMPTCSAMTCGYACRAGFADCDAVSANGCESPTASDPLNCATCGHRCAPRANAPATCAAGVCGVACDVGYTDCDMTLATGCEVHTASDPRNCGSCGRVCPLATDACVRGDCLAAPFGSNGSAGALDVTGNLVLPPGIYQYTTILIRAGARVTTNGRGVLDLRASGDVVIDGTIDVSGGRGGTGHTDPTAPYGGYNGGGGATGDPLGIGADGIDGFNPGGGGGEGGFGGSGSSSPGGGRFGGGAGAGIDASYSPSAGGPTATGSGGGGFAGGGGGHYGSLAGGVGGSIAGVTVGGSAFCGGGEPSAGVYAGGTCELAAGGGGGGSIGASAAADLAVATTFQPGSGGGGGRASYFGPPTGGGGGGGGGGAIRITSLTRITISATGVVRADGGAGGAAASGYPLGSGGGGSGGVVYLACPEIDVRGIVSAAGGLGNPALYAGGNGGVGRIRLSVLPERCRLYGSWTPGLVSSCMPTRAAPTPGRVYIDAYPF